MTKLSIKSAGYINGEWKVVLSDDSVLDGIKYIKVEKSYNNHR